MNLTLLIVSVLVVTLSGRADQVQLSNEDLLVNEVTRVVEGVVRVSRKNGTYFEGFYERLSPRGIILKVDVGEGGSVEVKFAWEEISSVQFAGDFIYADIEDLYLSGAYAEVALLLGELYRKQVVFFPAMKQEQVLPFRLLAKSYLALERPEDAAGIIITLKKYVQDVDDLFELEEIELFAYLKLGFKQDLVDLAKKRLNEAKTQDVAMLSWIALGFYYLNQSQFKEAWISSVQPLIFQGRKVCEEVSDAYLIAIIATIKLNRPLAAIRYYREYQESGLSIKEKGFQNYWVTSFYQINWDQLKADSVELESFADIQSKIQKHQPVALSTIPTINIPLKHETIDPTEVSD